MKKGDKKGLSTVIATMLVILLVIVAIVIVWTVIKSVIVKNSELISLGKFTIDLKIISVVQDSGTTQVKVQRNPGEGDIEGISFVIDDGVETHVFEKTDIDLDELETKTFVLDYSGNIASVSIYPIFVTQSGGSSIGEVSDTYYEINYGTGGDDGGDDGGTGGDDGGDDGGTCIPDCTGIICGTSINNCGECPCEEGYHCGDGICVLDCTPDCTDKQCGDNGCGGICGNCEYDFGTNYVCNELTWTCEICNPDCTGLECGLDPICNSECGPCSEWETCDELTQQCIENTEIAINTGNVYSYWPSPEGRMLFDSEDLPKTEGTIDSGMFIKFPGSAEDGVCMTIYDVVTPVNPLVYDRTYVKISENPTLIEIGDYYEIWETYLGCCKDYC